jgi:Divergent polysaccharide deacetylase
VRGIGTAFWLFVLGGSLTAIGAGYAGGHHFALHALRFAPPPTRAPLPEPIEPRALPRAVHGAESLDAADGEPDRYGDPDEAFSARPPGWAPASFDLRRGRPRIAIVVVGGDRSASALVPFAAEPFPLAVLVPAETGTETLRIAREAGMTALIDCDRADLPTIARLRAAGAAGIICSTGDGARARELVSADGGGIVLDDLRLDDALYRAARSAGRMSVTLDVTADARDTPAYVDFLLGQALAIAQRTGVAVVVVHARPASLSALERFAARVKRNGAELVSLAGIDVHS